MLEIHSFPKTLNNFSEKPLSKAILDQNNTKVGELQEKSERLYYKKEYAKAVELLDEAIGIEQTGREDKETLGDLWKQKAECCRELEKFVSLKKVL